MHEPLATGQGSSPPHLDRFAHLAALLAAALGAVVLAGWWGDVQGLREPIASAPPMVPNTALMFVLAGGALALRRKTERALARRLVFALAATLLGLTALTLYCHAFDADFGLGRLLVSTSPGLSAPNTAFAFALVIAALLVPASPGARRAALVEGLSLGAASIGMLALLGYALGVLFSDAPWRLPPGLRMAPHTAGGLIVLSTSLLLHRRDAALTKLLSSAGPGGQMARRLLLVTLATIPLTTMGAFWLQYRGFWQSSGSVSIAGVVSALVLVLATRFTGKRLDAAEAERAKLARELRSALRERERMHESEVLQRARLESIVAQMPVGVVVVDADGRLVLQNQASCALAKSRNPCAHDVRSPSGEPLPVELQPVHRTLRTGERIASEELLLVTESGERVPVIASAAPIRAGDGIVGAVTAFRDIRELKELERMREEWASIIAHDMRQPVNAISLNLDLLRRVAPSEKAQGPVGRIRSSIQRLNRMVEDLLDISRIESRRLALNVQPLRLDSILEEAIGGLPDLGTECELRLDDDASIVRADRLRVAQIVENLLTNAAKYGDPSLPVRLHAGREGARVVVSVENRGPGIPSEELQTLFERFTRSRSAEASSVRGLGLGLYICRGLVEAHGGTIWVESEPGGVTAFRFTLPLAEETLAVMPRVEPRASA